jgi:hypothetical protein
LGDGLTIYQWRDVEKEILSSRSIIQMTEDEESLLKILACSVDIEILNKKLALLVTNIKRCQDDESQIKPVLSDFSSLAR